MFLFGIRGGRSPSRILKEREVKTIMEKHFEGEGSLFLSGEEADVVRKILRNMEKEQEERKQEKKKDEWTREKIMAVKNITERQKLIKEHIELFK